MNIGRRALAAAVAVAAVLAAAAVLAGDDQPTRILFIAEDGNGTVWANLSLTSQRRSEPYIPMVVGVQNGAPTRLKLTRESFWLSDLNGVIYTMPGVRDWRKGYSYMSMDRRLMSTGGIPWEVWYTSRRFARTNFFPDLRASRGSTTIDTVTLREGYGMVDLMYFERPRSLESGRPFFLTVFGEGWETPIRLRLYLS